MKQKIKSLSWTLIKVVIALAIFFMIYQRNKESMRDLPETLAQANYLYLIPSVFLAFYMIFITSVRWKLLLTVQGIYFTIRHTLCINWIGAFFNNFMPGGTGGDLIKLIYAIKGVPEKKTSVLMSIVVDRLIGLMGLFILFGAMLILNIHEAFSEPKTRTVVYAATLIMIGCLSVMVIGLWRSLPQRVPFIGWLLSKIPFREKCVELVDAYQIYAHHPRIFFESLFISITVHLAGVFSTYFLALTFVPDGTSLRELLFIVPMINLLISIPVTPGGLGVREGLYVRFLTVHQGIAAAAALSIGLMSFIVGLIISLPGGLIYIFYKQHHEPAKRD
ncbi:MAG: lysylphosphatidylglycerol synthase transmembrane domain-containing protein [Verrucomicrobiota bacterium]|mgnify:CR=1 FL=1|nr:lysylphosphatidylglycerol synthase transmembrane domain-containing protein [Verrucomicrobiota bacterium]